MNDLERLIASSLEDIERSSPERSRPDRDAIERALARRRRGRVVSGVAATAFIGVVVFFALAHSRGPVATPQPVSGRNTIVLPITPEPGSVTAADITAHDGTVWFSEPATGDLVHIDSGGTAIGSLHVARSAGDIEVAFGRMWIADTSSARIIPLSLTDASGTGLPIPLGATPGSIELSADDEALWAVLGARTVLRIDPATGAVRRVPVSGTPIDVAARGGIVWVLQDDGTIFAVDRDTLASGPAALTFPASGEGDITVGADALWYGDRTSNELVRIDQRSHAITSTIRLPGRYLRIAVQPDVAWVLSVDQRGGAWATPVDPVSGKRSGSSIEIEGDPESIAIASERVWVGFPDSPPISFPRVPER